MQNLTELQKQLCTLLQQGIPVCEKPFEKIANDLCVNTEQVLDDIRKLKDLGLIRRFRAIINHRTLGKASTLVTAHVPEDKLPEVAGAVNNLSGVSHNYLRGNYYNLWFTLQAQTTEGIDKILSDLQKRYGVEFHSLPVLKTFKLSVQFNVSDKEHVSKNKKILKPKSTKVSLSDDEKYILSNLQSEIEITDKPFSFLTNEKLSIEDVLKIIQELFDKGVIRRIAAVINYMEVGFNTNVMFACQVLPENIVGTGEKLASMEIVSHCYERETFDGWPYNLFGMLHARSMEEIQNQVNEFVEKEKITSFQLLSTISELKKEPVQHEFK